MRSTIFTSLPVWGLLALSAAAAPEGCYVAGPEDLGPEAVVTALAAELFTDAGSGETWLGILAEMAEEGRPAEEGFGGQTLSQTALCEEGPDGLSCTGCEGGVFRVDRLDAGGLELSTEDFHVGAPEGCGGTTTLARTSGETTRYSLRRADPEACLLPGYREGDLS
ncbi:hypothetical protein [Histidinibacterium lentulum]|uniref:DUF3617 family protein n=1 Tax=Histidinibacterium lentulum TaxID=2480588 RepID=A0A3N2R7H2_9RHOB|nr:hypothetical protein [Histidinibacterium lentulum]ROU03348.1 hypothetical protein EAT49_03300 [Histidinibacterium lentulum]